ncbi:MAG: hypothetical protein PVI06_11890 [Desulfobacterales bacterium]
MNHIHPFLEVGLIEKILEFVNYKFGEGKNLMVLGKEEKDHVTVRTAMASADIILVSTEARVSS